MADLLDNLDNLANIQTIAYNDGSAEGVLSGRKTAFVQGFKMGQKIAFNVANEMGQYYGSCQVYICQQQNLADRNEKCSKLATQICELIEKFDVTKCHEERFTGNLTVIRDKYNKFCSLTNTRNYFSKQAANLPSSKLDF